MLEFDEAVKCVLTFAADTANEKVKIQDSLGRYLAHPVLGKIDLPPFSKSAMDGFAIQANDPAIDFSIEETIAAGVEPAKTVGKGQCSRIMTGAMMPPGADMVVRVENTTVTGSETMRIHTRENERNVIQKGENLRAGDVVLNPRILRPQDIGALSEQGIDAVEVVVPPLIGVLTTGTELRNPGETLKEGQIYNSNGYQLCCQVANMGGRYKYYNNTEDNPDTLSMAISESMNECKILLLTGGISMGDYDFVPKILQNLGVDIHFHKIAVKPGKPALFGSRDGHFVFGLPGNPVSAFVIFEILVKPFFFNIMNIPFKPTMIEGKISERISRKSGDRVEFRPVRWESGSIFPIKYRGSSHLHSLAEANGLIRIEKGVTELPEGIAVNVRQI